MSIAAHMLAFNGRNDNLFRGAIMESGAATTGLYQSSTSNISQAHFDGVANKAGCGSAADKPACLRGLNYSTLYTALTPGNDSTLTFFFPVIDGDFIAQSPSKQVTKGQFVKIPTLQGHNDDEGALFALSIHPNSDTDIRNLITGTPLNPRLVNTRILAILHVIRSRQSNDILPQHPLPRRPLRPIRKPNLPRSRNPMASSSKYRRGCPLHRSLSPFQQSQCL
jgi:carboxylesterase type B